VPLHANDEGLARAFDAFDQAIGRVNGCLEVRAQLLDALVMHAVHHNDVGVEDATKLRSAVHVRFVGEEVTRLALRGEVVVL